MWASRSVPEECEWAGFWVLPAYVRARVGSDAPTRTWKRWGVSLTSGFWTFRGWLNWSYYWMEHNHWLQLEILYDGEKVGDLATGWTEGEPPLNVHLELCVTEGHVAKLRYWGLSLEQGVVGGQWAGLIPGLMLRDYTQFVESGVVYFDDFYSTRASF